MLWNCGVAGSGKSTLRQQLGRAVSRVWRPMSSSEDSPSYLQREGSGVPQPKGTAGPAGGGHAIPDPGHTADVDGGAESPPAHRLITILVILVSRPLTTFVAEVLCRGASIRPARCTTRNSRSGRSTPPFPPTSPSRHASSPRRAAGVATGTSTPPSPRARRRDQRPEEIIRVVRHSRPTSADLPRLGFTAGDTKISVRYEFPS